ncbi:hypothetical protein KJ758_03850 [Patescibacteria group bacterium]|nr:hypothetical protein [Patescibacteria group bacterium]
MEQDYSEKAEAFSEANFRIYGLGNFDVYQDEIAVILKLIEGKEYKQLKIFYQDLHEKRMGWTASVY